MCVFPKQNDVVCAILKGIKTARCNFANWTAQELFLTESITKFFTIHISNKVTNCYFNATLILQKPILLFFKKY